MTVAELTIKMVEYSQGNLHDLEHFLKVWAYARTIGQQEGLDKTTQETLEIAALVHDIACPLCWEKYGSTIHKRQEEEGMPLTASFLADSGLPQPMIDRIVYLVGHHHTLTDVEGLDYRILLEADFLVNAEESNYGPEKIENGLRVIFRTPTGTRLLKSIYQLP